jgi:hypothetical protein
MPVKTGYYTLTADVPNPKPDRRKKRQLAAQAVWPAGTVVYVKDNAERDFRQAEQIAGEKLPTDTVLEPRGIIRFKDNSEVQYHFAAGEFATKFPEMIQGNGVIHAMVETPKTVGQIIKQADWTAEGLLALLVELGHVDIGTIDAIKHHDLTPDITDEGDGWKQRDAATDAFYKKHGI